VKSIAATVLSLACSGKLPCEPQNPSASVVEKAGASVSRTYENPVLPGFHADPSICRVGADYYLATSSFEYFPGVPIFHSRDLVHWQQIGHALTRRSQLVLDTAKSSQGIYAPTLRHHDGTFYLVTTNMSGGGSFYVTTRDPRGEWSDPVWLTEKSWSMDPSLFFDDDGKVYYTRHGGGERGGVYQAELDVINGKLLGEPQLIWSGTGGIWPEGPHLYKRRGTYYLMISEGGTGYEHAVTIARSASPFGPFEAYEQNPILTHRYRPDHPIQATGHADWIQAENGSDWLVLLGIRPTGGRYHHLGRETFLAPMIWEQTGWPTINGGSGIELSMASAQLPEPVPVPIDATRDDFDRQKLGVAWNFVRNPNPNSWSLSARAGFLRLSGTQASLDVIGAPAFVGRRQQHFQFRAEALLEFQPQREGEAAGLSLRQNEDNHYDLLVIGDGTSGQIVLRTRVKGETKTLAETRLEDGPALLTIEGRADEYEFFYAPVGAERRRLGQAPTMALSTEAAGGFTGVFVGMYATTSGSDPMPPADFDWFEYLPRL
jgi:alpha-N-arabinofuranosidase